VEDCHLKFRMYVNTGVNM